MKSPINMSVKAIISKNLPTNNHGKNICRLFHILEEFPFNASERELEYCQKKMNIVVASRAAERLRT